MLSSEISDFITHMAFERSMAVNTCDGYSRDLGIFAAWLGGKGVDAAGEITHEMIVSFLRDERDGGMSPATRARRSAAIRMFMKYLKAIRVIKTDPSELMDSQRKVRPLPRVLSEEETFKLIEAVNGETPRDLRDRAILEILYGCALRVSELCDMELDDIIADGELLRVTGKGSKERVVPIGGAAGRALMRYLSEARAYFLRGDLAESTVFLTRLGGKFTRQGVFKIIKERAAAVGIASDRISPHVMRHCFASHMLQHGADIRAIQELLGHANISTTQIYTHVDTARFKDIHSKYHPRG